MHTTQSINLHTRSVFSPAASSTALSPGVDGNHHFFVSRVLAVVEPPALTTEQLPDGATITFNLVGSAKSDMSNIVVTRLLGVQTGASGAGAPAKVFANRIPTSGGGRFFGLQILASAGTAATSVVQELKFGVTA
jgi:hypothetical protein